MERYISCDIAVANVENRVPLLPASLSPLIYPPFRAYWLAGLGANFGWLIQMVGASWLMTQLGGTAEQIALVQTSVSLPIMLFALPAGALADAVGRRRMVLVSQVFILLSSCLLAFFAWEGGLTPWALLGFTFAIGAGKAMNNPSWQTMVSELVPRKELPTAVALNGLGFNMARSVGPAIGGILVATVGAFSAFVVNAVGNIGVVLLAMRWPRPEPRTLPPEPLGGAILTGIRYASMSIVLKRAIVRGTIFNFAAVSVMALMPLVARDLIGGGPQTFGLLLGAFGFGAVGAAFLGPLLRRRMGLEGGVRLGFVTFAVAAAIMGLSQSAFLTLAVAFVAGGSWLITMSSFNATVQLSSPRWVLSRALAFYQTMSFGGNALGSWVWGLVAGSFGTGSALVASAVVLLGGAAIGLVYGLRELDSDGLDPHVPWTPPVPAVDMRPTSGPIVTTVEYRIEEKDIAAFHVLMAKRRRSRTRDGARRWTLSRDLQDPQIWYERFKTATWVETERHHQRRTVAGARLASELRALHRGGERPVVHYELVRHPDIASEWAGWETIHH